jgi:hypothetical protein
LKIAEFRQGLRHLLNLKQSLFRKNLTTTTHRYASQYLLEI